LGGHVAHGIIPYIQQRVQSINQQLQLDNISPEIFYPILSYPRPTDSLFFQCKVNDDVQVTNVKLKYTLNGGPLIEADLYDDGLHFDGNAGDRVFGNTVIVNTSNTQIEYSFSATDNTGQTSLLPACGSYSYYHKPAVPPIVINEFMADNTSALYDEYGEANDWIELYNKGNVPVQLSNMFLSDDTEFRNKWPLPDYLLAPDAYVLVWCDKDGYQGDFHANFKLSKSSGVLILSDKYANSMAITDYITYAQQITNKSYSRIPNGTGGFIIQSATPLYNNELVHVADYALHQLIVYPNPADDYCIINTDYQSTQIRLIDMSGRVVFAQSFNQNNQLHLSHIPAGTYQLLISKNESTLKQIPLIIIH
jgi:hypothetical protein